MRKIVYLGAFVLLVAGYSEGSSSYTYLAVAVILINFLSKRKKLLANRGSNNYKSHGHRGNYQGGTNNRARRETAAGSGGRNNTNFNSDYNPTPKPDNYGFGNNESYENNYSNTNFSNAGDARKKAEDDAYWEKKKAKDDAYFYRKNGGPAWKVKEADDNLGRTQRERDYEDDKWNYNPVCPECNYENCRCCNDCGSYPCQCCRECGEANCRCCNNCDRYPCQCCRECGEAHCRCCSRCDSYPCECCSRCGQPDRYCRCD